MAGCELLIMNVNTRMDVLQPFGHWMRGHVVTVQPIGHVWGDKEGLPTFFVLRITDMTVEECEEYLLPIIDTLDPELTPKAIRKWKLDLDDVNIPKNILNQINRNGFVSVTKTQIVNFIKRQVVS